MTEKIMDINAIHSYLAATLQTKKVKVREIDRVITIIPVDGSAAKENGSMPKLTREELDEMLKDSITESLLGAIPDSGRTLEDYRAERLSKYERSD
jgi:hypothetical protein